MQEDAHLTLGLPEQFDAAVGVVKCKPNSFLIRLLVLGKE